MNLEKNLEAFQNLTKNNKPKAIIFDWDNTLVNTWPLIQSAIDNTMVKMGKEPWGLKKVKDNIHKSMRESFPAIFGDKWEEAGAIYKNSYRATHLDNLEFLPGSLDLINKIQELGILQFVVSNKIGNTLRQEAEKLGVSDKFFALIGAGDADDDKPSKKPVELALLGSDLDPQKDEIWFIGDTIADISCGYNSNCKPIAFNMDNMAVSKTIPKDILENGQGQGALPLYFDHQDLINKLSLL
jgi:phosphoglycolate phosphatase